MRNFKGIIVTAAATGINLILCTLHLEYNEQSIN